MIRLLQINTNKSSAAVDIAIATALEKDAKYLLVSERNPRATKGSRWIMDVKGDAAIGIMGRVKSVTAIDGVRASSGSGRWKAYCCLVATSLRNQVYKSSKIIYRIW